MIQIEEAMTSLQVSDDVLSAEERTALDEDGYVVMPGLLDEEALGYLRRRFDEIVEQRRAAGDEILRIQEGSNLLNDLPNEDPAFDICWTHPRLLAVVRHILGGAPFHFSSLNGREPDSGHGEQGLHSDWLEAPPPEGEYHVVNSLWLLDGFTPGNGATRLVPGTHRGRTDGEEVTLTGSPGTLIVFNAHIHHGGTLNRSGERRRTLHAYFSRREHAQQLDQRKYLRPETYERLSPAARYLMDVE